MSKYLAIAAKEAFAFRTIIKSYGPVLPDLRERTMTGDASKGWGVVLPSAYHPIWHHEYPISLPQITRRSFERPSNFTIAI